MTEKNTTSYSDLDADKIKLIESIKVFDDFIGEDRIGIIIRSIEKNNFSKARSILKATKKIMNVKGLADKEVEVDKYISQLESLDYFYGREYFSGIELVDSDDIKNIKVNFNHICSENKFLKDSLDNLHEEYGSVLRLNRELQNKNQEDVIKSQVPEYVEKATSKLNEDIFVFTKFAITWAVCGLIFIIFSLAAVILTYVRGPSFNTLTTVQFIYALTRGLIGIGILCWVAQYCLSMTKSFTHEIVRRKDTIHSIRFGELFLKIFGSSVTKEETMSVFKNWNNAGNTAFNEPVENAPVVKLKEYGNDLSEVAKNLADLAAKLTTEKK